MRYDIISDTHGHLSYELLHELEGADLILHAGDCCSLEDYERLRGIARVAMCTGNNDYHFGYGPEVKRVTRVFSSGLRWELCHYEERLDLKTCDVAVCGHTHRPFVRRVGDVLVVNPGSPTYPRTQLGPTMVRVMVDDGDGTGRGTILSAEIVRLTDPEGKRRARPLR